VAWTRQAGHLVDLLPEAVRRGAGARKVPSKVDHLDRAG